MIYPTFNYTEIKPLQEHNKIIKDHGCVFW